MSRKIADPFENIGDDLLLSVLSFISRGPQIENKENAEPTLLTNVVPQVSKQWRDLSQHDYLWKPLLLKRLEEEPGLWREGLWKLIHAKLRRNTNSSVVLQQKCPSNDKLVACSREVLGELSYKTIYRQVVSEHIRFVGPVFYMTGHVLLGDSYRLHLFEPRYRLLVAELLKDYPKEARKGGKIIPGPNDKAPLFIHANRDQFSASSPACLVQIVRANISDRDGTADVLLHPIAYVWMEKLWVRPNSFNLHYVQCSRMGSRATREMLQLVNQEALDSMMNRDDAGDDNDYYADTTDDEFEFDEELGELGDWD